jgi:FdhD protein
MVPPKYPVKYHQFGNNGIEHVEAEIITETPVSLTVNGLVWLTFMCTPTDLEALAVGFLFNEGLIQDMDEIASLRLCAHGNNVDVWLTHNIEKPEAWRRTSGCTGGITSVEDEELDLTRQFSISGNGLAVTSEKVRGLISQLFESQDLYRSAGGVHTSALSDGENVVVVAEDIGRHNTLDKIAGLCLIQGIKLDHRMLLTTGRISSEMIQKAARMESSVVISRTSPSSLSIQLAKLWGITLIGYARRTGFRVYAHPERVMLPEPAQ